LTLIKDKK